jgi:hypothetical protein
MNRYENNTPRAAFAIAAVVMSLATMTAFVGAPAVVDNDSLTVVARNSHATPVVINPARIDVVASVEAPVTLAAAVSARIR